MQEKWKVERERVIKGEGKEEEDRNEINSEMKKKKTEAEMK